jgi:hypothetical protein
MRFTDRMTRPEVAFGLFEKLIEAGEVGFALGDGRSQFGVGCVPLTGGLVGVHVLVLLVVREKPCGPGQYLRPRRRGTCSLDLTPPLEVAQVPPLPLPPDWGPEVVVEVALLVHACGLSPVLPD